MVCVAMSTPTAGLATTISATELDRVSKLYHLKKLEQLETEQNESRQKLDNARKLANDRNAPAPKYAGEDAKALEHILERGKRSMRQHKVLLDWIEQ